MADLILEVESPNQIEKARKFLRNDVAAHVEPKEVNVEENFMKKL